MKKDSIVEARKALDLELGQIQITPEQLHNAACPATLERVLIRAEDHRRDSVAQGIESPSQTIVDRVRRNQVMLAEVRKRKGIRPAGSPTTSDTINLSAYGVVDNTAVEPGKAAGIAIDEAFGRMVADEGSSDDDDFMRGA